MSDDRYRLTLHAWAAQFIPADATVTKVEINYDDGWDPTFTDRPESLSAWISYEWNGIPHQSDLTMEVLTSVGELLTALFAIEETP